MPFYYSDYGPVSVLELIGTFSLTAFALLFLVAVVNFIVKNIVG